MIKPTKFLNLDNCIINISGEIIRILITEKKITYTRLYNMLQDKYDEYFSYNFLPAIDFLFLLGKVKYTANSDCLELVV